MTQKLAAAEKARRAADKRLAQSESARRDSEATLRRSLSGHARRGGDRDRALAARGAGTPGPAVRSAAPEIECHFGTCRRSRIPSPSFLEAVGLGHHLAIFKTRGDEHIDTLRDIDTGDLEYAGSATTSAGGSRTRATNFWLALAPPRRTMRGGTLHKRRRLGRRQDQLAADATRTRFERRVVETFATRPEAEPVRVARAVEPVADDGVAEGLAVRSAIGANARCGGVRSSTGGVVGPREHLVRGQRQFSTRHMIAPRPRRGTGRPTFSPRRLAEAPCRSDLHQQPRRPARRPRLVLPSFSATAAKCRDAPSCVRATARRRRVVQSMDRARLRKATSRCTLLRTLSDSSMPSSASR